MSKDALLREMEAGFAGLLAVADGLLAELKASKEVHMAASRNLPEERFQEGRTAYRLVKESCTDHYREHADEIRAWREREGI